MASDTSLRGEDRPPDDPAANSSPMSLMGSLIGSARRRFEEMREHRHSFQPAPSMPHSAIASPPHETTPLNNNGIVSPSITDSAQYQNMDDSFTPRSTTMSMTRSESPVGLIPPPQLGIPESPTRTERTIHFDSLTAGSSVGIDEDATQKLHWQTVIPAESLSMLLALEEYDTIVTKINLFAQNTNTSLEGVLQFATRMITRADIDTDTRPAVAEDIVSSDIPKAMIGTDTTPVSSSSRMDMGHVDSSSHTTKFAPRTDATDMVLDPHTGTTTDPTGDIASFLASSSDTIAASRTSSSDIDTVSRFASSSTDNASTMRTLSLSTDIIPTADRTAIVAGTIPTADPTGDIASAPRTDIARPTGIIATIVDPSRTATTIVDGIIPTASSSSSRTTKHDPPDTGTNTNTGLLSISHTPPGTTDPAGDFIVASAPVVIPSYSSWDTSMGLPYIFKLNSFALKRRNDIISQIKRVSPHMNLSETVSYARRVIDAEDMRRSTSDDVSSIASTDPHPPTPTVSFAPIETTIREDDDDDGIPEIQDRALHEDTSEDDDDDDDDGSIPAPSPSSTTVSDTASTLEKLVEIMTNNNKSNLKMQEQNLAIFHNAISAKQNKPIGTEFILKQMMMQKASDFTALPKDRNAVTVAKWYDDISRRLSRTPWDIDGISILDVHPNHDIVRSDNNYKLRSMHLATILIDILIAAGLNEAVEALESTIELNDGVLLLSTIRDYLLPTTSTDILDAFRDLATCVHQSGEPPAAFFARFDHIWLRIKTLGYDSIDDLRLASLQRGFLQGAYAHHESLDYYLKKLKHDECSLKDFSTCNAFSKHITNLFTTSKVIDDGHMKTVTGQHLARQSGGSNTGTAPPPTSTPTAAGLFGSSNFLTSGICTKEIATELFKNTDCPICRYPKSHDNSHYLSHCPLKKHFGFGLVDYKAENDTRKSDHERRQARTTQMKKKDVEDELTGAATEKVPTVSTATTPNDEKTRATAEKVVGKNGRDAKTEKEKKEAIASNLQKQAGTVRRLGMFQSGDNDGSNWVDADTTINELNNESTL